MKIAYLIPAAVLLLTGCGKEQEDTGKIKPSGDIAQFRELHDGDERQLVMRYESSISFGLQYECFTRVIDVYNDATVDVYGEAAEVPEEDNCRETISIGEDGYEAIIDGISETGVDVMPKVECDDQACDAGSAYMTFYDETGEYNSLGGYCVIDEKFEALVDIICENVPEDERISVYEAFEQVYADALFAEDE